MTFHLRVMYQVAIGWRWGSTPPWSAFWPWHFLNQLKPFWGSKHVLFELVSQNGISPGILDKSLFLQNGISPGILDKARSLSAYLAKRNFTRHTSQSMFSFSLLWQKNILLGLLDKHVRFCKLAFYLSCLTKHVLFQLVFCKTALHQAYLTKMTKYVLF